MGQPGTRKNGKLLPPHQGIQPINGGNPRLNKLIGIGPGRRIHRQTVDIPIFLRQNFRPPVDRLPHPIEHAPQHIPGHRQLEGMPQETNLGMGQIDPRIGLEKLDHRTVSIDLQHLSTANRSVRQFDLHQFIEGRTLHLPDHHQWPRNFRNGSVFLDHISAPPFSVSWAICWAISRAMVS